jgi:ABC-2 type transport system permease protein
VKNARNLLAKKKVDGYLTLFSKNETKNHLHTSEVLSQVKQKVLQSVVNTVWMQVNAKKLNISPNKLAQLNQIPKFSQTQIYFDEHSRLTTKKDNSGVRYIINIIFLVLTMIFTFTYSPIIAQEIANEKGTRIMEMILSSVQAKTYFTEKFWACRCLLS